MRKRWIIAMVVGPLIAAAWVLTGPGLHWDIEVGNWNGGLKTKDIRKGSGLAAEEGSLVRVHYVGKLPDGKQIVSTRSNMAHQWRVGDQTVIAGMDRAVRGMRPGGIRKAYVPYMLHYGQFGYGGVIPPNTPLEFEIEMLDVKTGPWLKEPMQKRRISN